MTNQMTYAEAYLQGLSDGYHSQPNRETFFKHLSFGAAYEDGFQVGEIKRDVENEYLEDNAPVKGNAMRTVVLDGRETGHKTVRIDPGSHTIVLDISTLRKIAIGDFVKKIVSDRINNRASIEDVTALAIGHFDVSITDIYDGITEQALSDGVLGKIVKYRMAREEAKSNDGAVS